MSSDFRQVGRLALVGLLLELGDDRLRVGVDLAKHMAHDIVLKGRVKQVIRVEVQTPPLDSRMRRPPQELARRVAEELGHVDPLDLSSWGGGSLRAPSGRARSVAEEVREEVVEQAATAESPRHPLLREVDLAEVFRLLGPVRANANA
jgi:hypothetical protein